MAKMTSAVGQSVRVKSDSFTRAGKSGLVLSVYKDGVEVDFFCDVFGNPRGTPSIEFWEFGELDPETLIAETDPL